MNIWILVILAVLAVAYGFYRNYKTSGKVSVSGGTTAFAKLADADGKLIALKAATEAKAKEAEAAHAALDEVHKMLG